MKSLYAARLAVCELQEAARSPKLQRCASVTISRNDPSVKQHELADCLQELQSKAVFWASYTNNLQNVGYMCQVARAEIEKEELVEQRRASLETTLLVTRVLSDLQRNVADQNADVLSYTQQVRGLHAQNMNSLATAREENLATMHEIRDELGSQLQSAATDVQTLVENVAKEAASSQGAVLQYIENVQHSVQQIWQTWLEGNAEVAARQSQDVAANHGLVVAVQQKLEDLARDNIGRLSVGLYGLSDDISRVSSQIRSIGQAHESLVVSLNQSLERSSHVVEQLEAVNMPILELLASTAKVSRFILTGRGLMLTAFWLSLVTVCFLAALIRTPRIVWLCKASLLLTIFYGTIASFVQSNTSANIWYRFGGTVSCSPGSRNPFSSSFARLARFALFPCSSRHFIGGILPRRSSVAS